MSKYFKFVGYISLALFAIVIVLNLIGLIASAPLLENEETAITWVQELFTFLIFLVLGPAAGLLFVSYGNHIENHYNRPIIRSATSTTIDEKTMKKIDEEAQKLSPNVVPFKDVYEKKEEFTSVNSTTSYGGSIIKIGVKSFNLDLQICKDVSVNEKTVSFSINSESFNIECKTKEDAEKFYNFLVNHK